MYKDQQLCQETCVRSCMRSCLHPVGYDATLDERTLMLYSMCTMVLQMTSNAELGSDDAAVQ